MRNYCFEIVKSFRALSVYMTEMSNESSDDTAEEFVNYMPGMPKLSREPGRVGQVLASLFGRRRIGSLRVVGRRRDGE